LAAIMIPGCREATGMERNTQRPLSEDSLTKSPTSGVLGLLPALWTQVLFPGPPAQLEPFRLHRLLVLLLVSSSLIFGSLSFHLFEPDEGRYAEIPREMLDRGDWTVPYLQGEPYLDKPPLLYWLVMLSYRVFGIHEWAARLVPAVALEACVLLTFAFGRRSFGDYAAFWSSILLSLSPGFVTMGRLLILDGLLTLWVTLSLFAAHEAIRGDRLRLGWWLLAALACGLGILTKGPVALLLLVAPCLAYCWLQHRLALLRWFWLTLFVLVCLAVPLPWYLAICVRSPAFARHFLWEHNIVRFVAPFDHQRPVWFYLPVMFIGLLPASLLLWPVVRFLISVNKDVSAKRSSALGFCVLAGGWCVVFFSLSGCKLPTYVMPAFPALTLVCGAYLAATPGPGGRVIKVMAACMFAVLFAGHNLALPWYAGYRAPVGRLAELRDFCQDPQTPIICYPRNCDSVAFYVGRDDLRGYRSKQTHLLIQFLQQQPRTVLLFTHRHSLEGLRHAMTPDLHLVATRHFGLGSLPGLSDDLAQSVSWLMGETSLGLCDAAVVERRR
jgi:hypothetical protein